MLEQVKLHCPSIYPWIHYMYNRHFNLYYRVSVFSQSGQQQGDPLGPLLFCLVFQLLLDRISNMERDETIDCDFRAAYIDDLTLSSTQEA